MATAAALDVTEPYSTGIGGGGFFVYYDAKSKRVSTIDGRETAPATFTQNVFDEPRRQAMDFNTVVSAGLSVGTPGTPATWDLALKLWGKRSLSDMLAPAETLARTGFVVDQTFHDQTAANAARFAKFPATAAVYLPDGLARDGRLDVRQPRHGRRLCAHPCPGRRNRLLRRARPGDRGRGPGAAHRPRRDRHGRPADDGRPRGIRRALQKAPIHSTYRGLDVYGMPVPSSVGIAVAEILNLLGAYDARTGVPLSDVSNVQYLHRFSEASATAFADRNRYVGDVPGVPVGELTSPAYAAQRATLFSPTFAQPRRACRRPT